MIKRLANGILDGLMRVIFLLYPYKRSQWLKAKKWLLYTKWIKNAIGELGENSSFGYPCTLQGGGLKKLTIGHDTRINPHVVIELWKSFSGENYEPIVKIGNYCNIGEYSHISAINKITIGMDY